MEVTTRGYKKKIDPSMSSGIEDEMSRDDEVLEVSGEIIDKSGKEEEVPGKVSPIPNPPPPFPPRLVKKTENGKYLPFLLLCGNSFPSSLEKYFI